MLRKPQASTTGSIPRNVRTKAMTKSVNKTAEVQQWLAVRKEAGLKIDPETAEVDRTYGQIAIPTASIPKRTTT